MFSVAQYNRGVTMLNTENFYNPECSANTPNGYNLGYAIRS